MGRIILSLAALAVFTASGAAPVQAKTLAPVTEWKSEVEADRCRVTRLFGTEKTTT